MANRPCRRRLVLARSGPSRSFQIKVARESQGIALMQLDDPLQLRAGEAGDGCRQFDFRKEAAGGRERVGDCGAPGGYAYKASRGSDGTTSPGIENVGQAPTSVECGSKGSAGGHGPVFQEDAVGQEFLSRLQ